ncbi:MAG: NADPH-dependent oxidoreductase, partial [Proteobacteria bacterium]|nr:NADPH-dependent oxidoreductase [Pseudomonadota bacterium]
HFSARHELQASTWTQRVLNRLGPMKSMNGRERMRAALGRLGFEIR